MFLFVLMSTNDMSSQALIPNCGKITVRAFNIFHVAAMHHFHMVYQAPVFLGFKRTYWTFMVFNAFMKTLQVGVQVTSPTTDIITFRAFQVLNFFMNTLNMIS